MRRNLIISPVGNQSLHKNWLNENQSYDLLLTYYGDSDEIFEDYKKDAILVIRDKGPVGQLNYKAISNNLELINKYENIWLPDDDIDTNYEHINQLFDVHKQYKLWLSQPSIKGYVSHGIELQHDNLILRYTNFVEVLCPMMSIETLTKLYHTYDMNDSSWGLDLLWPKILGYPIDRIAIIDMVCVEHTRPIGQNYNNLDKTPMEDLNDILFAHNLTWNLSIYSSIHK